MKASPQVQIRVGTLADVGKLADLATQLGYPSTPAEIGARLPHILGRADNVVLVAAAVDPGDAAGSASSTDSDKLIGFAHLIVKRLLVDDVTVELAALVVDERHRGTGCGRDLLKAAEEWTLQQGIDSLSLRSNVVRGRAHSFYERLGYARVKTSYAFRKNLKQ